MLKASAGVEVLFTAPLQEDTVSGSTEQSQVEGETGQGPVEVTPFLDPTSTEIAGKLFMQLFHQLTPLCESEGC